MANRAPMTDETKKKISEALRKKYGMDAETTKRDPKAQAYFDRFANARMDWEQSKSDRDSIKDAISKLPKGKKGSAQRKKLNAELKKKNAEMRTLSKSMASIKKAAGGEKSKADEKIYQDKSAAKMKQYDALITKITALASTTTNPSRRDRLNAQLKRAMQSRSKLDSDMNTPREKRMAKNRGPFNFNELSEDFNKDLNLQESRVDFNRLNEVFDQQQGDFSDQLTQITNDELDRVSKQAKPKLDAYDVAGIAAIAFMIRGAVDKLMRKTIKSAYEVGKAMASKELGISIPGTSVFDTQLMNLEADDIADAYSSTVENTAKATLKAGMATDASSDATIVAMRGKVKDEATRAITNIQGTVIGQYINKGREAIFFSNTNKIEAYQRTEVLDMNTCAMCLSLHHRVISPDDPMRYLESVHTHCRGLWVPILTVDATKPDVTGIPKSIADNFDLIDGRPTINGFKNMKKPINDVSKEASAIIAKKLK